MKIVLLAVPIVLFFGCVSNDYKPPDNNPLAAVSNYMVYYGENHLTKLKHYDLLVLQPELYTDSEVKELKQAGSIPIAYLSIGEIEKNRWWAERIKDSWLLGKNEVWDSYYIDPGNPGWQKVVLEVIIPSITEKGFRGLFLDTIDMVDRYPDSRSAMINLISGIREAYPGLVLVQNRGLSIFSKTAKIVNGIVFESMTSSYNFNTKSVYPLDQHELIIKTRRTAEKNGVVLFALDYLAPLKGEPPADLQERFYRIAGRYNYIPLATDISLMKIE